MQLTKEIIDGKSFLSYTVEGEIDHITEGMLLNNRMDGAAEVSVVQKDMSIIVSYDITGLISLKEFFDAGISIKVFWKIMINLLKGIEELREYMIDINHIVLNLPHIFINPATRQTYFIVSPEREESQELTTVQFLRMVINGMVFVSGMQEKSIIQFMNYINSNPLLSAQEAVKHIENTMTMASGKDTENGGNGGKNAKPYGEEESDDGEEESGEDESGKNGKNHGIFNRIFKGKEKSKKKAKDVPGKGTEITSLVNHIKLPSDGEERQEDSSFSAEESSVIETKPGDFGKTVFLEETETASVPYVEILKNGRKVAINKSPFIIGSSEDAADCLILGNNTVSKFHARILSEGGIYYLEDMDSLNHTFKDGSMLMRGEKRVLKAGDHFRLSVEEMEFGFTQMW